VGRIADTDERNSDGDSYESVAIDRVERRQRGPLYPAMSITPPQP
jgi:hypothetical protein